jgi:hypothetical protein
MRDISGADSGKSFRIWYYKDSKLPARTECHGFDSGKAGQTLSIINEGYGYHDEVPTDLFEPAIPEGYVNARPEAIRNKGQEGGGKD